jgi:Domain of unknown function (DUF4329)
MNFKELMLKQKDLILDTSEILDTSDILNTFKESNPKGSGFPFESKDLAALDWGISYNAKSIKKSKEYSSAIYELDKNGIIHFTYSKPQEGTTDKSPVPKAPNGKKLVAYVHSHGSWSKKLADEKDPEGYDLDGNNRFSQDDEFIAFREKIIGYVVTPDGSLKRYDYKVNSYGKYDTISKDMPFDPKDPSRSKK